MIKLRKRNSHHRPARRTAQVSARSAMSALRSPVNEDLAFHVLRRIV